MHCRTRMRSMLLLGLVGCTTAYQVQIHDPGGYKAPHDQEVDLVNGEGARSRWLLSQQLFAIGDRVCFYVPERVTHFVTRVEIVDIAGGELLGMLQGLPESIRYAQRFSTDGASLDSWVDSADHREVSPRRAHYRIELGELGWFGPMTWDDLVALARGPLPFGWKRDAIATVRSRQVDVTQTIANNAGIAVVVLLTLGLAALATGHVSSESTTHYTHDHLVLTDRPDGEGWLPELCSPLAPHERWLAG